MTRATPTIVRPEREGLGFAVKLFVTAVILVIVAAFLPVVWVVWQMAHEPVVEEARIAGPPGVEAVVLDTSGGATTGFIHAVVIVEAGAAADRENAVAIVSGPRTLNVRWIGETLAVCVGSARLNNFSNFYSVRRGDAFVNGGIRLGSTEECTT